MKRRGVPIGKWRKRAGRERIDPFVGQRHFFWIALDNTHHHHLRIIANTTTTASRHFPLRVGVRDREATWWTCVVRRCLPEWILSHTPAHHRALGRRSAPPCPPLRLKILFFPFTAFMWYLLRSLSSHPFLLLLWWWRRHRRVLAAALGVL